MNELIGTKGCSTPVGKEGRVRPRRRAEETYLSPHGKWVSFSGNQHDVTYLIDKFYFNAWKNYFSFQWSSFLFIQK